MRKNAHRSTGWAGRRRRLPSMQASFSSVDPRLIEIGGETYPALLKDYSNRGFYDETLGEFAGLRDTFVAAAESRSRAVLLTVTSAGWQMVGLYKISVIQGYGEPFTCLIGERVAKLQEVPPRKKMRHG